MSVHLFLALFSPCVLCSLSSSDLWLSELWPWLVCIISSISPLSILSSRLLWTPSPPVGDHKKHKQHFFVTKRKSEIYESGGEELRGRRVAHLYLHLAQAVGWPSVWLGTGDHFAHGPGRRSGCCSYWQLQPLWHREWHKTILHVFISQWLSIL